MMSSTKGIPKTSNSYELPKWAHFPTRGCSIKNNYPNVSKEKNDEEEDGVEEDNSKNEWFLEEIKNGIVLNKYKLDVPVVTFGRLPLVLEDPTKGRTGSGIGTDNNTNALYKSIITAHESCSRLHARIAFDKSGTPWLRDLASGNGTTVNKKTLPKQSIGKFESSTNYKEGSRGVIIYPGDVIQFGASTRIYVLNGPSYFDRGNVKARRQMYQYQNDGISSNDIDSRMTKNNGVSWGINFDHDSNNDDDDDEGENDYAATNNTNTTNSQHNNNLSTMDIPEKYHKLRNKIQSKKYKLQNIQTEMRRIQTKSVSMELSSGQQLQLERNEKQVSILQNEIELLEKELVMKLENRGNSNSNSNRTKLNEMNGMDRNCSDEEEDVDDFYDQTKTSSKRQRLDTSNMSSSIHHGHRDTSNNDEDDEQDAETLESLTMKWKSRLQQLNSTLSRKEHLQIQANEIKKEIKEKTRNSNGKGDDDDCFFLENDLKIINDQLQKVENDIAYIEKELTSMERLIKIINDKLVFDRDLIFIGTEIELDQQKRKLLDETNNSLENNNSDYDKMIMPPPPPLQLLQQTTQSNSSNEMSGFDSSMPPPPPVTHVTNDSNKNSANDSSTQASSSDMKPPPRIRIQKGPSRPPTVGTLEILQRASVQSFADSQKSTGMATQIEKQVVQSKVENQKSIISTDPKIDQWVAPKEQDGSGRTKLNAKFGGRY